MESLGAVIRFGMTRPSEDLLAQALYRAQSLENYFYFPISC
jgi:hypothetical protein